MLKILIRQIFLGLSLLTLFLISKLLSFGPLMGSLKGKLLATQVILPISAGFTGGVSLLLISILYSILYSPLKLSLYCISSVYHIPSLFAALSIYNTGSSSKYYNLKSISKWVNYIIPLICAIAFMAHPVGLLVPFYALYWLVPVLIQLFDLKHIFARSLAATFIAHCLGTVFFIYSFPTDINFWVNLSKIVWLERLIIASSMSLVYFAIKYLIAKLPALKKLVFEFNSRRA